MLSAWGQLRDTLHLVRQGGPALCNIAITNSCNATCDFCNFANGKIARQNLRWIDVTQLDSALDILHRRGIRYVSFSVVAAVLQPTDRDMIELAWMNGVVKSRVQQRCGCSPYITPWSHRLHA